jgi:hypothetical protein
MDNNLQIFQLSNYTRPEIKEVSGKKWVLNGDKNQFYYDIIDAYNGSPTNSAIIDSYSQFIYGKGLTSKDKVSKASAWASVMSMLSKSDLRKVCKDFEMFGEASLELKYLDNKLQKIYHIAKQCIAPEIADENGEISGYYFSYDFRNVNKYRPERFDAFGYGEPTRGERSEIFIISDYQVGQFYYKNPSYISGLPYSFMESEIANYCINHIQNGLSFGHVINMNTGVQLSEEEIMQNTAQIKNHLTGSGNAGKFFLNWNDNKDSEITITPLEVSDAHQQYQFLSAESRQQIMTSHKLTSGLIVGVGASSGFSSNADELEVAFNELMINVIRPKQEIILDGLMEIFASQKIAIDLSFISLRASDIVSQDNVQSVATDVIDSKVSYNGAQISSAIDIIAKVGEGILTQEQAIVFLVQFLSLPAEVAQAMFTNQVAPITQLSQQICCSKDKINEDEEIILNQIAEGLIELGEDEDLENFEIIDEREQKDVPAITELTLKLASVPTSFPNVTSEQDNDLFKIRYQYAPLRTSDNSREFCRKMVSAKKVYRKEDILFASQNPAINPGFGPGGSDTYNLFLYKGSVNCQHFFMRKIYLKRNNKSISVNEAQRIINELEPSERAGARIETNPIEVAQVAESSNNYWSLDPNYRK